MDDLPELPFEHVLSYLSLQDLIKSRAVSRSWRNKIDRFPLQSLCCSQRPSGFIFGKSRLISGTFAQNFISSPHVGSLLSRLVKSILRHLKQLRLCDLSMVVETGAAFAEMLQSFTKLKQLDLIRVNLVISQTRPEVELNLPTLHSLRLGSVSGIDQLTLDAPGLKSIKLLDNLIPKLYLVHGESVERLVINDIRHVEVEKLKKLRCLHLPDLRFDLTLLAGLQELEELHLEYPLYGNLPKFFEQKQRLGLFDLKLFRFGYLFNDLHDAMVFLSDRRYNVLVHLAENPSRLADEISFCRQFPYHYIERVAPESQLNLLNRFVDLEVLAVTEPIQNTQRFLDLLRNFDHFSKLAFHRDQPQDLFDRLPEQCTVQKLTIEGDLSDVRFLFKLKQLIHLFLHTLIDAESIREAFEELPFLSVFQFKFQHKNVTKRVLIEIDRPSRFAISIEGKYFIVPDLNSAIQLITE